MAESEWAKGMAQEFKAGKARKAEEDGKVLEEQRIRKGFASKLWTDVREAYKHKPKCLALRSERKFSPGKPVTLILSVCAESTLRMREGQCATFSSGSFFGMAATLRAKFCSGTRHAPLLGRAAVGLDSPGGA